MCQPSHPVSARHPVTARSSSVSRTAVPTRISAGGRASLTPPPLPRSVSVYGGGYFDRMLVVLKPRPFAVGVGFAFQQLETIYPQPFDMPMDLIVTET